MADALSDVLRVVRLEGGVFLHAEFSEPWCIVSQATPEDCGPLLTGVEHIILYHYVVEGRMFVQVADGPAVAVSARQAVVLPRNDEHRMGSDLSRPAADSHTIISPATDGGLAEIHYGGGGTRTRVICGFLGCQHCGVNPLITALPALLHLDTQHGAAAEWIRVSFEFAAGEIAAGRAGSDTVLAKLSEVLFVEAVRHHIEALPAEETGWLAGLRDPYVARALALIHGRLTEPWTVDELAREACISRSAFAERFTRQIGEPPMHYLARWRLQVAAHRLRQSQDAVARIGHDVGYESEAAFARAFRRHFGIPPAAWRRNRGVAASG